MHCGVPAELVSANKAGLFFGFVFVSVTGRCARGPVDPCDSRKSATGKTHVSHGAESVSPFRNGFSNFVIV